MHIEYHTMPNPMSTSKLRALAEQNPGKYPSRMGQPWEDEETAKLLKLIQKKTPITDIALEHQRTEGGINSKRKSLAAEYYFNDQRPLEEICKFTGLSIEEVSTVINRRSPAKHNHVDDSVIQDQAVVDAQVPAEKTGRVTRVKRQEYMVEVVSLLREIKQQLAVLIEKI